MSLDEQLPPQPGQQGFAPPPPQQGTSGLAIAGLILAFLAAPIGFILSLTAAFGGESLAQARRARQLTGTVALARRPRVKEPAVR